MKNRIDIYVNDNYGFDITANRNNIAKEEILENFNRAYKYDGCKNILRNKGDHGIKYTAKFETFKDYNVIIPASSINKNKEVIKQLDDVYKMMKLKRKEIKKATLKTVFVRTCIILAGAFAIQKGLPVILKWDDKNFERELEESGAIEMQQNLEMKKNHEESMQHFYDDKKIEEQQLQEQISEFEEQQEQFNHQQTENMINDMEQYRDLDTMPGVMRLN